MPRQADWGGRDKMTKKKACLLAQALLCVMLAALLAASAVGVYREGMARREKDPLESVYTPEIVTEKLLRALPLFIASLGLAAVCLALGIRDEGAEKPVRDPEIIRNLACAGVARPSEEMTRERGKQRRLAWAGWGAFALCMAPPAVYLASPGHFPERDLEGMFFGLMSVLLPFAAMGLCALAVMYTLRERSVERETKAARLEAQKEKARGKDRTERRRDPSARQDVLRLAIITAAVILIVAGALNGSALDVLYKAITICTECVGLG